MAADPLLSLLATVADLLRAILGAGGQGLGAAEPLIDALAEDASLGAHVIGSL